MKDINIKFIPHSEQRYDTVGDYWETETSVEFRITLFRNLVYCICILIHEIWEWFRTSQAGIREEDITKFDVESGLDDPGLSPEAPYHKEHMESDVIERMCIVMAGEDWVEYDKAVQELTYEKP